MSTGQKIELARKTLGLSRTELGKKLDCDQQTIYRWERDEVSITVERLKQIATAIQVPVCTLLDD